MSDLDAMSGAELTTLRSDIDMAIATASDRAKSNALQAAEAIAREHGFSLADLAAQMSSGKRVRGSAKAGDSAGASAVRFRNPEDHSQTWSGRGRRPRWFNEAEVAGRAIEDLRAG